MAQIQIGINIDGELEGSFNDVTKLGQDIRKTLETVLTNKVADPTIVIQRIDTTSALDI